MKYLTPIPLLIIALTCPIAFAGAASETATPSGQASSQYSSQSPEFKAAEDGAQRYMAAYNKGDEVYVDGKPTATAKEYSQQAIALANQPSAQPPPPAPPEPGQQAEWLPLGVWALAQEEKGDAYMFFQISIDKNGVVTGAYQNVLSGEKSPISGQVDKKTQRVAWKIGSNNTVIETGLQNLTQDVASCLVLSCK